MNDKELNEEEKKKKIDLYKKDLVIRGICLGIKDSDGYIRCEDTGEAIFINNKLILNFSSAKAYCYYRINIYTTNIEELQHKNIKKGKDSFTMKELEEIEENEIATLNLLLIDLDEYVKENIRLERLYSPPEGIEIAKNLQYFPTDMKKILHINSFNIIEEYRGQGLGSAILKNLDRIVNNILKINYDSITLIPSDPDFNKFYIKNNFYEIENTNIFYRKKDKILYR